MAEFTKLSLYINFTHKSRHSNALAIKICYAAHLPYHKNLAVIHSLMKACINLWNRPVDHFFYKNYLVGR